MAVSTRLLLDSRAFARYDLVHLDTADRRNIQNIGRFDVYNILLGIRHAFHCLWLLLLRRPALLYLPISQGLGGFLRDAAFLLPSHWLRIPVVIHLRGSEFGDFYTDSNPLVRFFIRHALKDVTRAIVLGERLRAVFDGLLSAQRVAVIPNGAEDLAEGAAREKTANGRVRGLFLSNLRERKGLFITIEAVLQALQNHPNLEFVFAGDWQSPEIEAEVKARLANHGSQDRISFRKPVIGEEKARLYCSSDFFVFPPIEPEGHPRVILEAMAASLPVITTDQGAITETVVDGETGFVVPAGDAEAIREKISWLVNAGSGRIEMGRAARERFLTGYTAERANSRLADLFAEVLNR